MIVVAEGVEVEAIVTEGEEFSGKAWQFGEIEIEVEEAIAEGVAPGFEALMHDFAVVDAGPYRAGHGSPLRSSVHRSTDERKPSSWKP